MAQKAYELTLRYFGRTIQLYTPMYLSNYCENQCIYCGFNSKNKLERKKLTLREVEAEAKLISSTGLKHILVLSGESREMSPVNYIKDCVTILKKYFSSISVEIYPLTEKEYSLLVSEGVDGLTIYQETYDEQIYAKVHPYGPKKDYHFRLDAPERGAATGIRNINIGVLLGLSNWRKDIFSLGLHAKYLQDKFSDIEIGISIPRVRPQIGNFKANCEINEKNIVQIITALRIFLPRLAISVSTRENPEFRDNLIGLGITRMSAGSSTVVGGHTLKDQRLTILRQAQDTSSKDTERSRSAKDQRQWAKGGEMINVGQFEISDTRSVDEIKTMLTGKGYQPVLKDWMRL
jgi:2-iminoacetate synthase